VSKPTHVLEGQALQAVSAPLDEASCMPPRTYTDPAFYEVEVEQLFRKQWLCAGRVDQVPMPGDYLTLDLLGEALLLVHGKDGGVRVISRVCRHRSADLLPGTDEPRSGNAASFVCPYHAWSYRLDGALAGAPLMQAAKDFDKSSCALPTIASEVWNGWVFVNLSGDAEPLAPQLAGLDAELAEYRVSEMVAEETAVYESPWNWRVLVENFMEAYHHLATHRDTLEPLFPAKASFVPDNSGPYSLLKMPVREKGMLEGASGLPEIEGLTDWQRNTLVAAVVFPFHLFALTAEGMAWYQLFPHEQGRFTLRIYNCFPKRVAEDPALAEARAAHHELTKIIHAQDIAACDAVWTGLQSRMAEAGRLCPLEKSIWELNAWWTKTIGEGSAGAIAGTDSNKENSR
jgi:phenylpropionate dioxygenase-like ring-hydroxylating dioxygenase large terminal subunit